VHSQSKPPQIQISFGDPFWRGEPLPLLVLEYPELFEQESGLAFRQLLIAFLEDFIENGLTRCGSRGYKE